MELPRSCSDFGKERAESFSNSQLPDLTHRGCDKKRFSVVWIRTVISSTYLLSNVTQAELLGPFRNSTRMDRVPLPCRTFQNNVLHLTLAVKREWLLGQ